MAKGYWVTTYRSVSDAETLSRYASLAARVIRVHGGRFLARGIPVRVYEAAEAQRCVVVEFESVEAAISAYESAAYQEARSILEGAAEREFRIVEGV
jgi:uncharacterized protein (DUF1330 family)